MRKIFMLGLVMIAVVGVDLSMVSAAVRCDDYFGERDDYEAYLDGGSGVLNEIEEVDPEILDKLGPFHGVEKLEGWWYPTYEEFLNGYE
jgi:hypothetical protein